MRRVRLEPWTSRSGVRGVNYHTATHVSTKNSRNIALLLHAFTVIVHVWLEVLILLNKNAL